MSVEGSTYSVHERGSGRRVLARKSRAEASAYINERNQISDRGEPLQLVRDADGKGLELVGSHRRGVAVEED